MVRMNIKNLTPETYKGFRIYIQKLTRSRYGTYYYVKITDSNNNVLHTAQAGVNFGVYNEDQNNKDVVLQKSKEYIDRNLAGRPIQKVKIGDIFYTSWGYDQTQFNFCKVVAISPSGKSAKCRMIGVDEFESSKKMMFDSMTTKERPNPTKLLRNDPVTFKIQYYSGKPELRGSYPFVEGHDSKRMGTFWKLNDKSKEFYPSHYA